MLGLLVSLTSIRPGQVTWYPVRDSRSRVESWIAGRSNQVCKKESPAVASSGPCYWESTLGPLTSISTCWVYGLGPGKTFNNLRSLFLFAGSPFDKELELWAQSWSFELRAGALSSAIIISGVDNWTYNRWWTQGVNMDGGPIHAHICKVIDHIIH